MTWRVKSLVLYQRDGNDRRLLSFNLNGVNVITGNSQTGKSAVLDILNYVLMSKSCPIPKGVIRQAVSHVGAHLVGSVDELIVVRPLPASGNKVSTQGWYEIGDNLQFPNEVPEKTYSRDAIKEIISSFTGIVGADVLSVPANLDDEVKSEANIRHAAPLIFQPQDVVANRHVSVPGLDSESHRRHMLDALPFLLGIESAEILAARSELREKKAELRALKLKEKERKRLRANTFSRGHKLWLEARSLGLVDAPVPESVPDLLAILRNLEVDERTRFDAATVVPNIYQLEEEEASARNAVQRMRKSIRNLRNFERSAEVHQDVVSRQIGKITVSELLPDGGENGTCPVCQSERFSPEQHREQLEESLSALKDIRAVPLRADAKARKERVRLEEEIIPLEERHEAARAKLRDAVETVAKGSTYMAVSRDIDLLLGRIAEYSRTVDVGDMNDEEVDLQAKANAVEGLQKKINSVAEFRKNVQKEIDQEMTELARLMEVEFKEGNASISVSDLSIKVQIDPSSDEMTSLSEVGSGANWVCYHLAAILAIHAHLARNECPVPRTLLIDQPSQAWFPEKLRVDDENDNVLPEDEEDESRVRAIYGILRDMATTAGFSQIIVMDHAKFSDDWFQEMIRHEWRHGEKLVPAHWIPELSE